MYKNIIMQPTNLKCNWLHPLFNKNLKKNSYCYWLYEHSYKISTWNISKFFVMNYYKQIWAHDTAENNWGDPPISFILHF